MLLSALAGFLLGFLGSVPVAGPIAALVLERSLARRYDSALGIGVGAAVAESVYALAAYVGLGVVVARVPWLLVGARAIGAVALAVVAVMLVRGARPARGATGPVGDASSSGGMPLAVLAPATGPAFDPTRERRRGLALGFVLAIVNPTFLATWSAAVATLFATGWIRYSVASSIGFCFSVAIGIGAWFALMIRLLRAGSERLAPRALRLARVGTAAVLVVVAVVLAAQAGSHVWARP